MQIYQAINNIMQEVPAISKDKENKQQGFKYRSIEEIMNVLNPILAKNKVMLVPQLLETARTEKTTKNGSVMYFTICKIKYIFYAEDGSYVEAITEGEGMDSGDKSTSKAQTMALKTALSQVFCIPTEEDPDGSAPEETVIDTSKLLDENEAKILNDIMVKKGINVEAQLQANYGVEKTTELTIAQKVSIMKAISGMPDVK